jgi:hypothetical protein
VSVAQASARAYVFLSIQNPKSKIEMAAASADGVVVFSFCISPHVSKGETLKMNTETFSGLAA